MHDQQPDESGTLIVEVTDSGEVRIPSVIWPDPRKMFVDLRERQYFGLHADDRK